MPVKRRRSKRRGDIDSDEWAYLLDEPEPADANPFTYMGLDIDFQGRASTLWREHGEAATAEFVSKYPGRRPRLWWRYSAVELRRQVSGATKLPHESGLAYGMRVYYDPFGRVANSPPTYETEAEYLERLGLWLPGERERLGPPSNVLTALAAEPSHQRKSSPLAGSNPFSFRKCWKGRILSGLQPALTPPAR